MKYIAKIETVKKCNDDTEELIIIGLIEQSSLKKVYKSALNFCRKESVLASIYKGIAPENVIKDDATKEGTLCDYQIASGRLGDILLWRKNHRKVCEIKERNKE